MSILQKIAKFLLPASLFARIESESKQWYSICNCGYEFNVWELGGMRSMALGNPTKLKQCPGCGKIALRTLHKR